MIDIEKYFKKGELIPAIVQEEGKPRVEILSGYGAHLGLELLTERHGKAGQRV